MIEIRIRQLTHARRLAIGAAYPRGSEPGADAILQLRADTLSKTDPSDEFWIRRAEAMTGERRQRSRSGTNSPAV